MKIQFWKKKYIQREKNTCGTTLILFEYFFIEKTIFALSPLARSLSKILRFSPVLTVFPLAHPARQQCKSIFLEGVAPALNSQEHDKCAKVGHEQGPSNW